MLFNSGVFLNFFAAVLLLCWLARNSLRARNLLIVAASYLFYGWWDWRFLGLLALTSLVDFAAGLALERTEAPGRRRAWLLLSVVTNLAVLGFFKYCNFFVASFAALLDRLGVPFHPGTLDLVLPVGISFYTFQAMSYTIDVYRREVPATRDLVNFLAFVSFFPQLVAGPIERARHLLPQFTRTLSITPAMIEEGVWLMLWGLFKKVALADNLAPLVELVYGGATFTAPAVLLGTVAFAFQIYCDFSGYSDIARGTARVMGFDIMVNFRIPYAAGSPREFWQRWHISLSTWLRDYLYVSLGGNRRGPVRTYRNLLLTMLLGGLWHGAAWHFVLWGLWHGGGLMAHRLFSSRVKGQGSKLPGVLAWGGTMLFVLYGWLLFRATSLEQIVAMTRALGDFTAPLWLGSFVLNLAAFTLPLLAMEVWLEKSGNQLAPLTLAGWAKAALQGALLLAIVLFWERRGVPFIYFQF
jgi:D-alanyl-lipoteichoic acid acyltransferase DltB (MBOAT superfamily)